MNHNYPSKPNKTFRRAVFALRRLFLEQNLETVQHAFAEAIWQKPQQVDLREMTEADDEHVCIHRLLGEPCPGKTCLSPRNIPGYAHGSEWQTNGKTTRLVFQPERFDTATLQALLAFCATRHLHVEISAEEAWRFPGGLLFVTLTVQEPAFSTAHTQVVPDLEMVDFN